MTRRSRLINNLGILRIAVVVLTAACLVLAYLWQTNTDFGDPRWGTWGEWVAGFGAVLLLLFEMVRVAVLERRADVSTARRVHSWLEPNQWVTERQGVVISHPAGWLLVVANDTDDVVAEWAATVSDVSGRVIAGAASCVGDGSLPPRRPLHFVLPGSTTGPSTGDPPEHYTLEAETSLRFRDHAGQVWNTSSDGSVRRASSGGRVDLDEGVPRAMRRGPQGVQRQGIARRQEVD